MGTDPINGFKWYKMVLETTSATIKQNVGQKVFKTPLWKLQNWTSADKIIQVITENSQLQKEQHMDSFTAACSLQASHHRENVALCSQWTASPSLNELLSFITHLCRYKWAQTFKEMWLFTSWNHFLGCSYAFWRYSSCGITAKKILPTVTNILPCQGPDLRNHT